jgi:hypothetical protein
VAQLPDRPDLDEFVRGDVASVALADLLERIDVGEARHLLVELNRGRSDAALERLLSALPPT